MFNTHSRNSALAIIVAGLLTACGGDGYSSTSGIPQIQGLQDQSVAQDTPIGPLTFNVTDADSDTAQLVVTATSSDTGIIPNDGIAVAGTGASRTLQITPAADAIGTANIVVRVVDPQGNANATTIRVQLNAVYASFLDTTNAIFAVEENGAVRSLAGMTFTPDADDVPTAFDALLQ
jgi:hypothetical protein